MGRFTDAVNGTQDVANPANYTVQFQSSGVARIQADCNRGAGGYTYRRLIHLHRDRRHDPRQCPDGSQSDDFVRYLDGAAVWFMDGDNLFIDLFRRQRQPRSLLRPTDILCFV